MNVSVMPDQTASELIGAVTFDSILSITYSTTARKVLPSNVSWQDVIEDNQIGEMCTIYLDNRGQPTSPTKHQTHIHKESALTCTTY